MNNRAINFFVIRELWKYMNDRKKKKEGINKFYEIVGMNQSYYSRLVTGTGGDSSRILEKLEGVGPNEDPAEKMEKIELKRIGEGKNADSVVPGFLWIDPDCLSGDRRIEVKWTENGKIKRELKDADWEKYWGAIEKTEGKSGVTGRKDNKDLEQIYDKLEKAFEYQCKEGKDDITSDLGKLCYYFREGKCPRAKLIGNNIKIANNALKIIKIRDWWNCNPDLREETLELMQKHVDTIKGLLKTIELSEEMERE